LTLSKIKYINTKNTKKKRVCGNVGASCMSFFYIERACHFSLAKQICKKEEGKLDG